MLASPGLFTLACVSVVLAVVVVFYIAGGGRGE